MLTFSDVAKSRLAVRRGQRLHFRVELSVRDNDGTFATAIDITPYVSRIGPIRSSVRPFTRESEIGAVTIVLDNKTRRFSPYNDWSSGTQGKGIEASVFAGYPYYNGSKVQVFGGVKFNDETSETLPIFTGLLDYVEVQSDAETEVAVFKVDDVMTMLRIPTVGDHVNDPPLDANSPAALILELLGPLHANIPIEFIDTDSFSVAASTERASGYMCTGFALTDGTWYDNIAVLLRHGATGIRVAADGRLQYFSYRPGTGAAVVELRQDTNFSSVTFRESFGNIRNRVVVQRSDGVGGVVDTLNSPIVVADSVTPYGERSDSTLTLDLYEADTPAEQVARKNLSLKAWQLGEYDIEAHIELLGLECGDAVRLYDDSLFIAGFVYENNYRDLLIFERSINPEAATVTLKAIDTNVGQNCYIILDQGIELDDGCLFY